MQNLLLTSHMYSKMLCLNNLDVFHKPAEKDCSPGRRCGGDCEIFLESGWSTGATRTRCSRLPVSDMDGSVKAAPL